MTTLDDRPSIEKRRLQYHPRRLHFSDCKYLTKMPEVEHYKISEPYLDIQCDLGEAPYVRLTPQT